MFPLERKKKIFTSPWTQIFFCLITCKADEPPRCPFSCSLRGEKLPAKKQLVSSMSRSQAFWSQFFYSFLCTERASALGSGPNWVQPVPLSCVNCILKREGGGREGRREGEKGLGSFVSSLEKGNQDRGWLDRGVRGQRWRNYLDTLVTDLHVIKQDKNKSFFEHSLIMHQELFFF